METLKDAITVWFYQNFRDEMKSSRLRFEDKPPGSQVGSALFL